MVIFGELKLIVNAVEPGRFTAMERKHDGLSYLQARLAKACLSKCVAERAVRGSPINAMADLRQRLCTKGRCLLSIPRQQRKQPVETGQAWKGKSCKSQVLRRLFLLKRI